MAKTVLIPEEKIGIEPKLREIPERIAIITPVYNEVDTIENTIRELHEKVVKKLGNISIWAFEDGSTDGTKDVLKKLDVEFSKVHAVLTEEKKGYPRAVRDAFLSISQDEYDFVVAVDSDGQYDPDDFFKLLSKMRELSPDIVMGRRITRQEPPYRKLLSRGLQLLESFMFPVQCTDVTSVMRLMRVKVAHEIAGKVKHSPYNFWLEFTARMSLSNYSVIEVPIKYRERAGGSKVYSVTKMPKVITSEFKALRAVKKEFKISR